MTRQATPEPESGRPLVTVVLAFMGAAAHGLGLIPGLSSSQLPNTHSLLFLLTVGNLAAAPMLGGGAVLLRLRYRIGRWFILGGACLAIGEIGIVMARIINAGVDTQNPLVIDALLMLTVVSTAPATTVVLAFSRQTSQYCG